MWGVYSLLWYIVYIYIYVCMYVYMFYIYFYICIYIWIYIHMYIYGYICIHVCIYTYMCTYMYIYICVYKYICICIYVYMYVYIYICVYMYIYIYVYVNAVSSKQRSYRYFYFFAFLFLEILFVCLFNCFHTVLWNPDYFKTYLFGLSLGPKQVLPIQIRVVTGVIAMKVYLKLTNFPKLKSHTRIPFCVIPRKFLFECGIPLWSVNSQLIEGSATWVCHLFGQR